MAANTTPQAGITTSLHLMAAANSAPTANSAMANLTAIGDVNITYDFDEYKVVRTLTSADDIECEATSIGTDADQIAIFARQTNGTASHYAITYSPAGAYNIGTITRFQAFIGNTKLSAAQDDRVMLSFMLKITGPVTTTPL
ncbi:MAG: hypothetical protein OD918_03435 [Gammaproteobacteria bacterium]